jgi:LysM repeat protein
VQEPTQTECCPADVDAPGGPPSKGEEPLPVDEGELPPPPPGKGDVPPGKGDVPPSKGGEVPPPPGKGEPPCKTPPTKTPPTPPPTKVEQGTGTKARHYTVKKGDTLSKIAERFDTTWQKLFAANKGKISDPNLIYPGQVLRIPGKPAKGSGKPLNHPTPPPKPPTPPTKPDGSKPPVPGKGDLPGGPPKAPTPPVDVTPPTRPTKPPKPPTTPPGTNPGRNAELPDAPPVPGEGENGLPPEFTL